MALQLAVKIWADTKQLIEGLKSGEKSIKDFDQAGATSFRELTKQANAVKRALDDVVTSQGANSKAAKNLAEANNYLQGEVTRVKTSLSELSGTASTTSGVFSNMQKDLSGMVLGVQAVINVGQKLLGFFTDSAKYAIEDETANKRMLLMLDNNTDAYNRMLRYKKQLLDTTTFSKEEINQAATYALSIGHTEAETRKMVEAAMALAKATGGQMDVTSAMTALQGTYAGQMRTLKKYVGELTTEQLANGGAIDAVLSKYGNLITEGLDTTAGKIKAAEKSWQELREEIAGKFLPAIGTAFDLLNSAFLNNESAELRVLKTRLNTEIELAKWRQKNGTQAGFIKKNSDEVIAGLEHQITQLKTKQAQEKKISDIDALRASNEANKNAGSKYYPTSQAGDAATFKAMEDVANAEKKINENLYSELLSMNMVSVDKAFEHEKQKLIEQGVWEKMTITQQQGEYDKIIQSFEEKRKARNEKILEISRMQSLDMAGTSTTPIQTPSGTVTMGVGGATIPAPQMQATGGIGKAKDEAKDMSTLAQSITYVQSLLGGFDSNFRSVLSSIGEFSKQAANNFAEGWQAAVVAAGNVVQSVIGAIGNIINDSFIQRGTEMNAYYDAEKERIQGSSMSEAAKNKALDKLNKDQEKKRKELAREQAKDQKTIAIIQAVIAAALAIVMALASPPGGAASIVMAAIIGAAAVAQIALIASQPLPSLAQGGLAYAPTMALIGDNPNARVNPEVIAPLDKLRAMMQDSGGGGILSARVTGDDLLFVMERASTNRTRTRGY